MERPALARLLEDIKAGKVNVVVVYKVDRLTRALSDFAKIVEQFDKYGVSFVSVTQQFNTTSSMGRLTLNVLLSFAQFEREVAGERIRDKIAASKKKGMWMGGSLSLGYRVEDRKLYIISDEAKTVRHIYECYLVSGNVRDLQAELKKNKIVSKCGADFSRGALYQILKNPLYIGKVRHRSELYDGQHEAILQDDIWLKVQERLKENATYNEETKVGAGNSLLAGILYSGDGAALSPTHTNKSGRRYHYYIDGTAARGPDRNKPVMRIPANDLEQLVLLHIKKFATEIEEPSLLKQINSADKADQKTAINSLIKKITVKEKSVVIELKEEDRKPIVISYQFVVVGNRGKSIASDGMVMNDVSAQQQVLLKALIRGYALRDKLLNTPDMTLAKLAEDEKINGTYLMGLINLTYLAPDIIAQIIEGSTPPHLNLKSLIFGFPISWQEHRKGA